MKLVIIDSNYYRRIHPIKRFVG